MNNSHDVPASPQPDWTYSLPRDAFAEIILVLRGTLPPPAVDKPQAWARRDRAAMASVAALQPVTAAEGRLAAQFVAADAYGAECLRVAHVKRREPELARRCAAQAISMMRESKSALRMLLRLQAERRALAKDAAAATTAEWVEHAAVNMMAEALAGDVAEDAAVAPAADFLTAAVAVDRVFKSGRASVGANSSRERRVGTTAGFYGPGDRARS